MSEDVGEIVEVSAEVTAEMASLRARLVQAELRTEAVRAGMVDLDGVRLLDRFGTVVLGAQGIEGGTALMARMKEEKPWLFGRRGVEFSQPCWTGSGGDGAGQGRGRRWRCREAEWRAARGGVAATALRIIF